MTVLKTQLIHLFVAAVAFSLAGCGGGNAVATSATNLETAADVAEMLREFNELKKTAPGSLADLDKSDASATHPLGHGAVTRQEFVVFWRTAFNSANGDTVVAYDKEVPAKGGAVIMGDGKVKSMTADEFSSAKKAGTTKK